MKKFFIPSLLAFVFTAGAVFAEGDQLPPRKVDWAFNGVFGKVDKQSAQRGFQIYKEVCSACHSLNRIAFRNLTDLGFSDAEVKALAASYQIPDLDDSGSPMQRPGKPSDYFPAPFPNDKAAAAANGGVAPPDLSLITKARADGGNYVYSLLTGFGATPPADVKVGDGLNYNPYFPGGQLRMPPPLSDGRVSYTDGTNASLDQEARDVVTFLQWAAEPEMEARKEMGLKVLIYLAIFTGFMYIAKRNVWRKLH